MWLEVTAVASADSSKHLEFEDGQRENKKEKKEVVLSMALSKRKPFLEAPLASFSLFPSFVGPFLSDRVFQGRFGMLRLSEFRKLGRFLPVHDEEQNQRRQVGR